MARRAGPGRNRKVHLTQRERVRYTRWWLDDSGLRRYEIIDIAIGFASLVRTGSQDALSHMVHNRVVDIARKQ